jgi:hypothetical protein
VTDEQPAMSNPTDTALTAATTLLARIMSQRSGWLGSVLRRGYTGGGFHGPRREFLRR